MQKIPQTKKSSLKIKNCGGKGKGLFSDRQYEHTDIVLKEKFVRINPLKYKEIATRQLRYLFCDGYDRRIPELLGKFINHSKNNNLEVARDNKYIYFMANCTIKAGEELTINYGEENITFDSI